MNGGGTPQALWAHLRHELRTPLNAIIGYSEMLLGDADDPGPASPRSGTGDDVQEFDSYTGGDSEKKFLLHYNFPNFSVGETGRISRSRPPRNRPRRARRTQHRADVAVEGLSLHHPHHQQTIESNGSSSMATVCGGTLALMDAGVPMIRPVAGISVGICLEYSGDKIAKYQLLTDILGWEDHYCDMDCKIAGTEKGITGFQLDLKLKGLPHALMTETIEKARVARMHILAEMAKTLAEPRKELSKYAPRIEVLHINPEKIGLLIGPGGKNIKKLVEESGCEIDIEDDGTVNIFSVSPEGMKIAVDAISGMTAEAEVGKISAARSSPSRNLARSSNSCPARRSRSHQRTCQLPRQEDRGHLQSRRRHGRQMPRRGRERPRAPLAPGRDGRPRQGNGRGEKGSRSGGAVIAI